ncbi:MAG: histidine kinase [Acidobacteriota bacterium]
MIEEPAAPSAAETRPRRSWLERRRFRWLFIALGWVLLSLFMVFPFHLQFVAVGEPVPWTRVVSQLIGWYLWGLFLPPIWYLVRRFPLERRNWTSRVVLYIAFGLLISAVYGFLDLLKAEIIESVVLGRFAIQLRPIGDLATYLLNGIELSLIIYFTIVLALYASSYYRKYFEGEVAASRLEAQLVRSQLDVLKMQLHPHFLFNTLNAISALMHRDVDAADRMIALLSDLLRRSLEKDDRHEVPLRDELELLDHYLQIERIRFRDRLQVMMDIDPECLDAHVPKLILQPLVENAIRHGIAMASAAGRIAVVAERRGRMIRLEVADDGPGLPRDPSKLREGVGLANTRARMQQLYGVDQRLDMRESRWGGLAVVLELPFSTQARLPTAMTAT